MRHCNVGVAALAALALLPFASGQASAAQLNPQNTNAGPVDGTISIVTNTGASITCRLTFYMRASGAVVTTTNSAGTAAGPTWTSCSNTISSGLSTTVTSATAWTLTIASTSSVNGSSINFVARIGGICTITASGVTVNGLGWSNATHTFTMNSAVSFPITESGLCDGGTTARLSGFLLAPTSVTIG